MAENNSSAPLKTAKLPLAVRTAPERIWLDLGVEEAEHINFAELEVTWSDDNATGHGIAYVRADTQAVAAQAAPSSEQHGWQPIETAPKDQLVMVYTPPTIHDYPDSVNIRLDHIDSGIADDYWYEHGEHYEHYCCVAKPEGSIGPNAVAPYTHWHAIPAAPSLAVKKAAPAPLAPAPFPVPPKAITASLMLDNGGELPVYCLMAAYLSEADARGALAALAATPALPATEPARAAVVYAEARECSHCNHVGINDSADGVAACINCAWHGDSPKEDKCPECEAEGTMTASCPKCHHEYRLLADASIATPERPATEDSSAGDLAEPSPQELMALSNECKKLPGGMGMHYLNYAKAVLARWGTAPQAQAEVQAEPVMFINPKVIDKSTGKIAAGTRALTHAASKYGGWTFPVYAAPQAQPADALDRIDAERLRALGIAAGNEDKVFERAMNTFREPNEGESSLDYLRAIVDNAMAAAQEGGNASAGKDGSA